MSATFGRFAAALALGFAASALAEPIQVNNVGLEIAEARYSLYADFHLELTPPLFELTRPRWYWFDQKSASEKLELRLAYLPLAQQYRLSSGTLHQNFPTLAEALQALGTVHGWPVLGQDSVDNGRKYIASVRMRLDPAQLPTPFRVSAVTNRDWTLASEWKRFPFTPLAPVREAR
ncbi:MAG: DUF4390 domain-containing protein [Betaproteobacteria bacterium]|nr:MAG: DUF4390 domain-containing protein [Betaproteobacteria bacterium]